MQSLRRGSLVLLHKHLSGKVRVQTNSIQYYLSPTGVPRLKRRLVRSSSPVIRVINILVITICDVSGFEYALDRLDLAEYAVLYVK